jgi:hypothetical protein
MQRRDVLKLLGSTVALSALPREALAVLIEANAAATHNGGLKTLNAHQDATVVMISEMIIPETDTPGAKGAKVNEFIDLLLSEWFEPEETKQFLAGLDQVDTQSRARFSASFVDCSEAQRTELLKNLDAAAMLFTQKQKEAAHTASAPPPMDFFYMMKKLTLTGYYTSETGFAKELGKSIIPPGHAGCAPLPEVSK